MILNSEDTDVGVINEENAEGGNIRIESYRMDIVRLGTRMSLYIFLINMQLICTELLFILQGVSVRDAK